MSGIGKPTIREARDEFGLYRIVRTRNVSKRGRHGISGPPGTTRRVREKMGLMDAEAAAELQKWLGSDPSEY